MTALSTVSTPPGGVTYDLTTESLSFVKLANPCSAAIKAGSAFLRSSSAIAFNLSTLSL